MSKAFECKMCGTCCRGEGGILVEEGDIERISRFLGKTREEFLARDCERRNGKTYIRCGDDEFCTFYHAEKRCLIHPVKPRPCTLWPFYPANVRDEESWKAAQDACPGICRTCSFEDFVRQSQE